MWRFWPNNGRFDKLNDPLRSLSLSKGRHSIITMKKILILALFALMALPIMAQSNDKKPGIDKENCTYTNKDGKTFNLYGKWKVVESFPDIKIQIVDSFEDIDVKLVESFPDDCGKVKLVESFPDVKVQFVNSFPDIKVKFVDSFPGVKK